MPEKPFFDRGLAKRSVAVGGAVGAIMVGERILASEALPKSVETALQGIYAHADAGYQQVFGIPLTPTELKGAIGATILMVDAWMCAFDKERPPFKLSLLGAVGLTLLAEQAYELDMPLTSIELGTEGVLYGIAAVRGSGETGKSVDAERPQTGTSDVISGRD